MKTNIKNKKDFSIILILFLIILFISFVVSICVGSQKISLNDLLQIFNFQKQDNVDNKILMLKNIIFKIRIPRSLLIMFSGFTLAGCGCVFQGFFRNPLAEPGILGISSGATLGAVFSLLLPSFFSFKFIQPIALFAFLGAIISGIIIFLLSLKSNSFTSTSSIILTGTALGTFFSSITSIILLSKQNQLHSIYVWLLGSFSGKGWNEFYFLILPFNICFWKIFRFVISWRNFGTNFRSRYKKNKVISFDNWCDWGFFFCLCRWNNWFCWIDLSSYYKKFIFFKA